MTKPADRVRRRKTPQVYKTGLGQLALVDSDLIALHAGELELDDAAEIRSRHGEPACFAELNRLERDVMLREAGCRAFTLSDEPTGSELPLIVMYPSDSPAAPTPLGPYELDLAPEGRLAAGMFALIVISHGTGGTGLVYRTTAADLARAGFVVILPEHPGNNRADNRLANTLENLENRPRHIRTMIDWGLNISPFAAHLRPQTAAVIGHSMGGYTALATAGGVPTATESETPNPRSRRIDVGRDDRVKALVLLAPATPWFSARDALARVRVPILMFTGEKDEHTPAGHAEIVERTISDSRLVEHRVIPNAGHFSFQSPFPDAMKSAAFAPSQDPAGFDRARFNTEMNAHIAAFLKRVLV